MIFASYKSNQFLVSICFSDTYVPIIYYGLVLYKLVLNFLSFLVKFFEIVGCRAV